MGAAAEQLQKKISNGQANLFGGVMDFDGPRQGFPANNFRRLRN